MDYKTLNTDVAAMKLEIPRQVQPDSTQDLYNKHSLVQFYKKYEYFCYD